MKRGLYFRLAATGMSKNKKFYFPYIFTCFCMVMMYYIIQFLRISDDFRTMRGGESMQMILGMGTPVIAVFSWILLYYTNSFLIRRRQKEFGWTDPCLWSNAKRVKGTVSVSHCL